MVEFFQGLVLAWLYFVIWFCAVGTYLRLERSGDIRKLPRFIYWSLYIALIPGVVLDFIFNLTYGTIHYRQIPKDWLFSATTARILRENMVTTPRYNKARKWKHILNTFDPGHV